MPKHKIVLAWHEYGDSVQTVSQRVNTAILGIKRVLGMQHESDKLALHVREVPEADVLHGDEAQV